MSPDGQFLVIHDLDATVFDVEQKEPVLRIRNADVADQSAFTLDGRRLAVTAGSSIEIWNMESLTLESYFSARRLRLLGTSSLRLKEGFL